MKGRPGDPRESFGSMKIFGVLDLDEAVKRADIRIRGFVGDRDYTIWQTQAEPSQLTGAGEVMSWDVEVSWRVTT